MDITKKRLVKKKTGILVVISIVFACTGHVLCESKDILEIRKLFKEAEKFKDKTPDYLTLVEESVGEGESSAWTLLRKDGEVESVMSRCDIYFNEGISHVGEVVDLGVEKGIIDKAGAWYSYNGNKIGQGRENAKDFLRKNPDISQEIENKIIEAYNLRRT